MHVTELTEDNRTTWDTYVRQAAYGLPQHLSGWRDVLQQTYDYETHYLLAHEADRVVGVIPLYLIRSFITGTKATTMPGGLCADTVEVAQTLIGHAGRIARDAGADRLVLHDTRQKWPGDLQTSTEHVFWRLDIRMSVDELWDALDGNIRRQVRIARRNELRVEIDRSGALLDEFYELLSRFTHQIGTPNFGRDFLDNVVTTFPRGFNIAVVYREAEPIGAYFQLELTDTVYGLWGATLRQYLKERPVYLAYWEILRDAIENDFSYLDMGRSRAGSSVSKHKSQWGGVSKPIHQQIMSIGDDTTTESIVTRVESSAVLRWMRQLWPKVPFPIVQFLGPKLRRHVPFG